MEDCLMQGRYIILASSKLLAYKVFFFCHITSRVVTAFAISSLLIPSILPFSLGIISLCTIIFSRFYIGRSVEGIQIFFRNQKPWCMLPCLDFRASEFENLIIGYNSFVRACLLFLQICTTFLQYGVRALWLYIKNCVRLFWL